MLYALEVFNFDDISIQSPHCCKFNFRKFIEKSNPEIVI